jgi:hypothetical protein
MTRHDVRVGAPRDMLPGSDPAADTAPALLQRSDEDFVDAVLAQLRTEVGRRALRADVASARTRARVLKLFQPVQRQFHVAVVEAWCDTPGTPRIDPARVESAGMVVRRIRSDATGQRIEGWMRANGRLLGWLGVARLGGDDADPTAANRRARSPMTAALGSSRNGSPRRSLVAPSLATLAREREESLLDEHVIPMFAAPPDVCAEARKTFFYGLVPTTSAEIADVAVDATQSLGDDFGPGSPRFTEHLVAPLRGEAMDFVLAGETMHPGWFEAAELGGADKPAGLPDAHWAVLRTPSGASGTRRFILLLRQLAGEFDAFGESAAGRAVLAELDAIRLPLVRRQGEATPRSVAAGSFLRLASRVLLERDPGTARPEMPASWPALDQAARARLAGALSAVLRERVAEVKGRPGRFDDPGALYALRAFVRLKPEGECPARTEWSAYSEPFVIAPWYEGSGAAPVQVLLPDATDREFLRSLRPNVAFVVPPSLQNLLGGSAKDMLEGKGSTGGLTIGWLCGFNIPVITICAFIVLNVFLSLFDLIFRWLFFIKICVPFPKRSDG